jgi:hypothetical protein
LQPVVVAPPQLAEQVFVEVLHARFVGHSVALEQPQAAPPRQTVPASAGATQLVHAWPVAPQEAFAVPTRQVPPTAAEQQPSRQACPLPHEVVQAWVVVSQAVPDGQSRLVLQPQVRATQALPASAATQSEQAPCASPQLVLAVPGWQVPLAQQPPLQGRVGEHEEVQAWVTSSQAELAGQSPTVVQPQAPPRQALPLDEPAQSSQTTPSAPHWLAWRPPTQTPPLEAVQQPPLHGWFVPQVLVQT